MTRARVRITGAVQGVCFRAATRDLARSLGVAGWVRNTPDGAVEALLQGEVERVERLLAWFRHGPAGARVDAVEVEWEEPAREAGFRVVG